VVPASQIEEAEYCRILERTADAVGADLRAAVGRPDLSPSEARAALARSTPAGSRRHVDAILAEEGLTGDAVATFVTAHPDAAERCSVRFQARMQSFRAAFERLQAVARTEVARQPFPWRTDFETARTEAREHHRPLVIVFCAAWTAACDELDRKTFSDDRVREALAERFVAARADMTDDDDASTKRAEARYGIQGLPVIVVFDARGKEAVRITEWIDASRMLSVLDQAAPR
jgi:hypothetical protein